MGKKRLESDTADWHVFTRGSRRMALFRDDEDHRTFVNVLRRALEGSGCVLWAFVLMANHYHLVLRADSRSLRRCMHHLNGVYSRYHNEKYGLSGHAFEGPYEAYRQGTIALVLRTISYVLLNPVTAGLVTSAEDFPWSSAASFFGKSRPMIPIDLSPLLKELHPDRARAAEIARRIFDQEARRLAVAERRPGLSAREIQASHFDWLLEEAERRSASLEGFSPLILALHWARQAGFHRSSLALALGAPLTSTLRSQLARFRKWLEAHPSRQEACRMP